MRATSAGAAVSEAADAKLMSPFSEKENAPFSSTTAAAVAASSPLKAAADGVCLLKHSSPKPRRSALAPLDVNSPIKVLKQTALPWKPLVDVIANRSMKIYVRHRGHHWKGGGSTRGT